MSNLKLEVGKTYVFIDDEAKDKYFKEGIGNESLTYTYYKDGFKLHDIINGSGFIDNNVVINKRELKYFKLKETKKMKTTDIVNVEMTALQALKLKGAMSYFNNDSWEIYKNIEKLGEVFADSRFILHDYSDCKDWCDDSKLTKWALSQFEPEKTEQQIKIEKLRKTIDDAKAQIEALEG